MSQLHSCPHCSSLNPQGLTACLNCDATLTSQAPSRPRVVKNLLRGAGLIAISMTLSACYGGGEDMCVDADLDGVCSYNDCDDNDSEVGLRTGSSCEESTPAGETMSDPEL